MAWCVTNIAILIDLGRTSRVKAEGFQAMCTLISSLKNVKNLIINNFTATSATQSIFLDIADWRHLSRLDLGISSDIKVTCSSYPSSEWKLKRLSIYRLNEDSNSLDDVLKTIPLEKLEVFILEESSGIPKTTYRIPGSITNRLTSARSVGLYGATFHDSERYPLEKLSLLRDIR